MYRCSDCGYIFDGSVSVTETHSLNAPPYETVNVCPKCQGTNYGEYKSVIPKCEVAKRLLEAVCDLRILRKSLESLFGKDVENKQLDGAVGNLCEFLLEMFPNNSIYTDILVYSFDSGEQIEEVLNALAD